ncbi:ferredoxin [Amycolatopsis sp. NPDC024027]|uniref:ferredoxin n=1 Tax=Amycolatopsis sp. NPDC024027 TaxID=3154327 RepID=UPI0033CECEF2
MRVSVDENKCVSSGQCAMTAPAVFDQHEDSGVVWLRTDRPAAEQQEDTRSAALVCPVVAITVTED